MDCYGSFLSYLDIVEKYNLNCSQRYFNKICKAIPLPLIHLIQNFLIYNNTLSILPNLLIDECNLVDKKCNNKFISCVLKSRIFHDYCRGIRQSPILVNSVTLNKAYSKFIKWSILPKVKETHFKILNKIYPVSEFLKKRFTFEVDLCSFCNNEDETLEHLFFLCPVSQFFGQI